MDIALHAPTAYEKSDLLADRNQHLTDAIRRERVRLGHFIRKQVPNPAEAEDILQDVLTQLTEAWRLPEPIEQVGAWLFRVARSRIIDRFRKHRELPLPEIATDENDDEAHWLTQALPTHDGGPEAAHMRRIWLEAIEAALEALPPGPRETFIAHEIEGQSFKDMARQSGVPLNTLLSWKRQAVLHLRERLQPLYHDPI